MVARAARWRRPHGGKGAAAQDALQTAGDFGGKPLLDATNPVGPGFVLTHGRDDSGAEHVQRQAPSARVVKVFNSTGLENMADPVYPGGRAFMPLCGDDLEACDIALRLAADLGFEAVRVGGLSRARLIEPAAALWIAASQALGTRDFAFGLIRR